MEKLAFCFLLKSSTINNLDIWEDFFRGHEDFYEIYVHAADNQTITQKFVNDRLINEYYTTWGDIYLAVMALYKRAVLNGCKKVILLSGCCIPVKTFPAIYSYLTNDDSSYLAYQPHLAKTENERKTLESSLGRFLNNSYRSSDFARNIDITHWFYNETWTILNRYHAELILEHSWLLDQFRRMNCYAHDENFPSYVLSLTGELKNVINKRTTFTNWRESSGDKSKRHPKNYESISSSDLEAFKPFLFARKFSCISDIAKQLPLDSMIYTS